MPRRTPLNDDILELVFGLLENRSDISAMTRASRSLRRLGAKHLLKRRISFTNGEELHSFCLFMTADITARAPYLRQLHLCLPFLSDCYEDSSSSDDDQDDYTATELEGLRLLPRILRRASRLEDLGIDNCESLLRRLERLAFAFTSLTSVEHLRICSFGELSYDIVTQITSNLRSLNISFRMDIPVARHRIDRNLPFPHFLSILTHHPSLETITARYVNMLEHWLENMPDPPLVFPHVRALTLHKVDKPNLAALHAAFPCLRELTVFSINSEHEYFQGLDDDNNEFSAAMWPTLDLLCGDAYSLFALGVKECCVHRLETSHPLSEIAEDAALLLNIAIAGASPTRLVLHIGYRLCEEGEDGEYSSDEDSEYSSDEDVEYCDPIALLRMWAALGSPDHGNIITHLALDVCILSIPRDTARRNLVVRVFPRRELRNSNSLSRTCSRIRSARSCLYYSAD